MAFSIGMVNALLYCYFGAMANDSYAKMRDGIFELKWYELPIEQQKYLILMGANMQRPLHYHGFGVLFANLETFTRVSAEDRVSLVYAVLTIFLKSFILVFFSN